MNNHPHSSQPLVLGIESSCDETGIAVIEMNTPISESVQVIVPVPPKGMQGCWLVSPVPWSPPV